MSALTELLDFRLFFLAALLFVPLERLAGARPQRLLRAHWANDLFYVFANGVVIRLGLVIIAAAALAASAIWLPAAVGVNVRSQPIVLQVIEVMLLADLGFYWAHRAFHAVPALWRLHSVHHSIEEMDWLAAARVHPIDQIATKSASLLPCFLLGFSPAAIAAFAFAYHWHSLLLHANLRLGFGPLSRFVASPNFHHWHHARDREAWDRNFAGQFALWDRMFGTFHLPQGRTAGSFGIGESLPATYGGQLVHPFRRPAIRPPGSAAVQGSG